jgi:hypothetical protein
MYAFSKMLCDLLLLPAGKAAPDAVTPIRSTSVQPSSAAEQQLLSPANDTNAAAAVAEMMPLATQPMAAPARLSPVSSGQPIMPSGSHPFHPDITVTKGVLEEDCRELMVKFFKRRRKQAKEAKAAAAAAAAVEAAAAADVDAAAAQSNEGRGLPENVAGSGDGELRARYFDSEAIDARSDGGET